MNALPVCKIIQYTTPVNINKQLISMAINYTYNKYMKRKKNQVNVLPHCRTESNCTLVRLDLSISMYFEKAVGQAWEVFIIVLGCIVLFWCYSCVYNTNETMKVLFTDSVSTTTVLDLLIRILSAPYKILCVPLTLLHTIKYLLEGY